MRRVLGLLLCTCLLLFGCHRPESKPPAAREHPQVVAPALPSSPINVVIVYEGDRAPAQALAKLLAHFGTRCALAPAEGYTAGGVQGYHRAFYLAGEKPHAARKQFAADLRDQDLQVVWVGPGVEALGRERLAQLGVSGVEGGKVESGLPLLQFRGQSHRERLALPAVSAGPRARVLAKADRSPFICGEGKLWYAAAAPSLTEEHFWSTCIWAEALHEIMGEPHRQERTMLAALREVPVWANESQAPNAARPLLKAGIPVTLLATVQHREVSLGDRPRAVEGLRRAERLGATVALSSAVPLDAEEQLRLAWEVGLHPIAWQGGARGDNPFRMRFAQEREALPFEAGGLLPSPIPISDAGYLADKDVARLKMLGVVRDPVAVFSFGLWAEADRFREFLRERERDGWRIADLRDLGALVRDMRRIISSRQLQVAVPEGNEFLLTTFGRDWEKVGAKTVTASSQVTLDPPRGGTVMLEPSPRARREEVVTAVTLDPWAYTLSGMSGEELAETLAERYQLNGVKAVFFYAYNVEAGAAYRTRYPGATRSEWAHEDLLGHLLEACHSRGIKVIAWLYSGRDRGMWTRHKEWRERTAEGKDYNPLRLHAAYFLCPRHPEVRRWYAGLLGDLVKRYPTLDGVELCEPLVNWYGDVACYCDNCRKEFARAHPKEEQGGEVWRRFRADGLTEFLSGCLKEVSQQGIETYVMTICDALDNGAILTSRRQWEESGLDLDALLDGPYPPDWVNFEIIWQQWAVISKHGTKVFNPDWAAETAQRLSRRVDGRARVMIHLELTDFGLKLMTPEKLAETIHKVMKAEPEGVECYHSAAFDRKEAWPQLSRTYTALRKAPREGER